MRLARAELAGWAALIACAAWLLSPALHPVHVEGFSASVVALGLHLAQGTLDDFFPSQPFATEYFALTKLGVVLGIAGLATLGWTGDAAMRLLMAGGGLTLLLGSAWLVRRWTRAPRLLIGAMLLLLPGVVESSFFFNDNVPAVGILVLAFVLFEARQTLAAALAAGALVGLAIATRTDVVLVAPALALIAIRGAPLARAVALTGCAAVTTVATLWFAFAIVGATPFDSLRVGATAVELWDRSNNYELQVQSWLLFAGLPGVALGAVGLAHLAQRRDWRFAALLVGPLLLVNVVLAGKLWEARQLLALTPFVAAIATVGAQQLVDAWRGGRRVLPLAVALGIGAILLGPQEARYWSDGPRALTGRFAGIADWKAWEGRVRANLALIDRTIAAPGPEPLVIVARSWNEDRYLHLRLMEADFTGAALPSACARWGQARARSGRVVVQLSAEQTFAADPIVARARFAAMRPCLDALAAPALLLTSVEEIAGLRAGRSTEPTRRDPLFATTPFTAAVAERLGGRMPPDAARALAQAAAATRARTTLLR